MSEEEEINKTRTKSNANKQALGKFLGNLQENIVQTGKDPKKFLRKVKNNPGIKKIGEVLRFDSKHKETIQPLIKGLLKKTLKNFRIASALNPKYPKKIEFKALINELEAISALTRDSELKKTLVSKFLKIRTDKPFVSDTSLFNRGFDLAINQEMDIKDDQNKMIFKLYLLLTSELSKKKIRKAKKRLKKLNPLKNVPVLAALNNNNTLYEFCTKLRAYYESLTPYCVLLLHIFDIIDGRKSLVERELTDDVFYSMFHRLVRPGGDWRRLGSGEQESRPKLFEYLSTHTNLPNLKAFVEFIFYDVRQVRNKIAHAANLNVELKQNKKLRNQIEVLHRNRKSLDMVSYLLDYYLLCL